MRLQNRRVLLIYKTVVQAESVLTPKKCTAKVDPRTRYQWILNTANQLDECQTVPSPANGMRRTKK